MRHLKPSVLLTSLLSATGLVASEDSHDVSALIREAGRASNDSLLWGPYKSNLYFGVRPRIPKSLSAGLIWGKVDDYANAQKSMFLAPMRGSKLTNPRLQAHLRTE